MSIEKAIAARRQELARTGYRKEPTHAVKRTRKQYSRWQMIGAGAGGLLILILLIMAACTPKTGTDQFGICRTFIELYVKYPTSLSVDFVEQYEKAVRIGYTQLDASGQFRYNMIECSFGPDSQGGMAMINALLNRKEMDKTRVEKFSATLPVVVSASPNRVLPLPLPADISQLKRD
ncbi:MAG TPA: hypothetical protein PKX87_04175 [Alphaproteobacteria bacterium]|nr:hypothetical protein [Alphaproteobacteria bacterium]